jgi:glucose-6-phosphate 1-dehydrogenase
MSKRETYEVVIDESADGTDEELIHTGTQRECWALIADLWEDQDAQGVELAPYRVVLAQG